MKNIIIGTALFLLPLYSYAELNVVSEFLVGKTENKIHSTIKNEILEDYSASLKSDSFAFRLGVNFTENFTFELAKHKHGDTVNNFTISVPTSYPDPNGTIYLPPESDTVYEANIAIDLESIRIGIKGQIELFENASINTRIGFAHWKYDKFTPLQLTYVGAAPGSEESGNDVYYAIGAEYKFTDNFYLGFEYSFFTINERSEDKSLVSGSYEHDVKDLSLVLGWAF